MKSRLKRFNKDYQIGTRVLIPLSPLNEEFAIKRKFLIFIYLRP